MKIKNYTEKQFEIAANHIALNAWKDEVAGSISEAAGVNAYLNEAEVFLRPEGAMDLHPSWGVEDIPVILKLMEAAQMILEVFKKEGHQHPFFDINQN